MQDAQKQLYYMSDTIELLQPEKVVECFEVREKIGEVAQLVAAQFASAGVTLELVDATGTGEFKVSGDQNEFKQSVLNLMRNAFDAVVARHGSGDSRG